MAGVQSFGVGSRNRGERLLPPSRIGAVSLQSVVSMAAGDPVSLLEADIPGISSLFSSADGGPNDPRVKLLAQAYQQAVAGLNIATPYPGTGLPYLQNWLNDQPPHPTYSNGIAQQLITAVMTKNPQAAAAAVPGNQTGPAVNPATGQAVTSTYAGAGGGISISPVMLLVIAGGAYFLLRK